MLIISLAFYLHFCFYEIKFSGYEKINDDIGYVVDCSNFI